MASVRALAAVALVAALAGCASEKDAASAGPLSASFQCEDGQTIRADFSAGYVQLGLGGASLRLPQARSASGARFEGGNTELWIKGEEARLTTPDGKVRTCRAGNLQN